MHTLYRNYFCQAAYQNTFLVNHPGEIARATSNSREWNNVKDSGCHFTCLAMIAGLDPAALATALVRTSTVRSGYFTTDTSLQAKSLSGSDCDLVWDRNEPTEPGSSITTKAIWHPILEKRLKVTFTCVDRYDPRPISTVIETVIGAISRGNHIICGPVSHSVLVAGFGSKGPFVWDPDPKMSRIEAMVAGGLTLADYAIGLKKRKLMLYEYACSAA